MIKFSTIIIALMVAFGSQAVEVQASKKYYVDPSDSVAVGQACSFAAPCKMSEWEAWAADPAYTAGGNTIYMQAGKTYRATSLTLYSWVNGTKHSWNTWTTYDPAVGAGESRLRWTIDCASAAVHGLTLGNDSAVDSNVGMVRYFRMKNVEVKNCNVNLKTAVFAFAVEDSEFYNFHVHHSNHGMVFTAGPWERFTTNPLGYASVSNVKVFDLIVEENNANGVQVIGSRNVVFRGLRSTHNSITGPFYGAIFSNNCNTCYYTGAQTWTNISGNRWSTSVFGEVNRLVDAGGPSPYLELAETTCPTTAVNTFCFSGTEAVGGTLEVNTATDPNLPIERYRMLSDGLENAFGQLNVVYEGTADKPCTIETTVLHAPEGFGGAFDDGTANAVVRGCVIRNNATRGWNCFFCSGSVFENNVVYGNGDLGVSESYGSNGNVWRNNTITNHPYGVWIDHSSNKNAVFENNIIANSSVTGFTYGSGVPANYTIRNNLYHANTVNTAGSVTQTGEITATNPQLGAAPYYATGNSSLYTLGFNNGVRPYDFFSRRFACDGNDWPIGAYCAPHVHRAGSF